MTVVLAGQHWQRDEVNFEVLHTQARDDGDARKTNAMSCSLRDANGGQTALLVGDSEQGPEVQLLSRTQCSASDLDLSAGNLRTEVLLVAHQGTKPFISAAWLNVAQPCLALA